MELFSCREIFLKKFFYVRNLIFSDYISERIKYNI